MSFLMGLDTDMFVDLVGKALEKEMEDRLWEKWLVELPNMDEKTFMPFDSYKQRHFQRQKSDKADSEILKDAENILGMMNV
jgi:hypothetical protein